MSSSRRANFPGGRWGSRDEARAAALADRRSLAPLGLTAAAALSIHPHYLAYFNAVSGGPDRGSRHLIDSNLDWGQDLVNLRKWLEKNAPGEEVGLAYFGQIHPRIFEARGEEFRWFMPPPIPGHDERRTDIPVAISRFEPEKPMRLEAWSLRGECLALTRSPLAGIRQPVGRLGPYTLGPVCDMELRIQLLQTS